MLILYRWRAAAREVYQDYRAMRRSVLITTLRHSDAYLLGGRIWRRQLCRPGLPGRRLLLRRHQSAARLLVVGPDSLEG